MATEEASPVTTDSASLAKWGSVLAALVGIWVLVSPFVLTGPIASGTAMWSNVVAGAAITVLAAFGAYSIRTTAELEANSPGEIGAWIAGLVGIWVVVSPFVLSGTIATQPVMGSNVAAGVIALLLAAYAGFVLHSR